jgi:L-arabinokinase
MTLVFHISGHGFGHASRSLEVVGALRARRPDARIVIRSSVARWFIDAAGLADIIVEPADTDVGMVQIDSLRLDEDETARQAARFYADFQRRVTEEAAALRRLRASIVIADIPPLAFPAARAAGVPSVALGNFTWDWIYEHYPQFESIAPGVLATIRTAYATATCALRLPLHGGFAPMADVTRDLPFIARRAGHARTEVRRLLGLDGDRPVVLASFGGNGLALPYSDIARDGRFTLVLTDHEAGADEPTVEHLRRFRWPELNARGLRYADLVAASDVVVTKPGYGIISECVANGAAMLYTSRGRFIEHDMLVAEMPKVLRCRFISQEDLTAGRWSDEVEALLRQPKPLNRIATNGADVAADEILSLV